MISWSWLIAQQQIQHSRYAAARTAPKMRFLWARAAGPYSWDTGLQPVPKQPAFPHVSPPRDAQMVHDAMVQDVIPLIVEPGRELIQLRRTSGAGSADDAGCVPFRSIRGE